MEEYHLTLKSGCRIEALRLAKWESLEKAVVMYTSVAARIVALRDRAAQEPDAPATVLLSEDECAVLVATFGKGQGVVRLTLGQAVLWIGRLGGHMNRRRDGMPGVRTLWRGLRDLTLLVEGWRVARRLENRCGEWSVLTHGAHGPLQGWPHFRGLTDALTVAATGGGQDPEARGTLVTTERKG